MVVTIDGPSGAGKSTVSRKLALLLGFAFLDTGALYRGLALAAQWAGLDASDETSVAAWLEGLDLMARPQDGRFLVLLEGRDVEPFIRNEQIAGLASRLSTQAAVRGHLLSLQRQAGVLGDLVAEGRDMGTVVFPRAEAKFFLNASPAERARRRFRELGAQQPGLILEDVLADLNQRDQRDASRALSPLRPAADATLVDTTLLDQAQVLALLLEKVRALAGRA
ncbi:MAG: (d)CMP kinase [Desulfarculus sp.]|nr:(d)CMP kinase [Desulfarculus sp.]